MTSNLNEEETEWCLARCGNFEKYMIPLDQDEVIVGRGCTRCLRNSPGISRKHVLLKKKVNNTWVIKDLHSTNGVYVNKVKIDAGSLTCVKEFDMIGLGIPSATTDEHFCFILHQKSSLKLQSDVVVNDLDKSICHKNDITKTLINTSVTDSPKNNIDSEIIVKEVADAVIESFKTARTTDKNVIPLKDCVVILERCDNILKRKHQDHSEESDISHSGSSDSEENLFIPNIKKLNKRRRISTSSEDDGDLKSYLMEDDKNIKQNKFNNLAHSKISIQQTKETALVPHNENKSQNTLIPKKIDRFPSNSGHVSSIIQSSNDPNKCVQKSNYGNEEIIIDEDFPPNIKTEKNSLHRDIIIISDDNCTYSQKDEIIIISDDDEYFNVTKVKKEVNIDDIQIKKEVDHIVENMHTVEDVSDMYVCDTVDDIVDYGDYREIDDDALFGRISWPANGDDPDVNEKEDNLSSNDCKEDFFPILSQSFYSDDELDSDANKNKGEALSVKDNNTVNHITSDITSDQSKDELNKHSVQVIEAKEMAYRPKSIRGREEWFSEQKKNESVHSNHKAVKNDDSELLSKSSLAKFYGNKPVKYSESNAKKNKQKPSLLKKKLKENMGSRLRFPGGGSAIRTEHSEELRIISAKKQVEPWSKDIEATTKTIISNNISQVTKVEKSIRHKVPVHTTVSRSSKLAEAMMNSTTGKEKGKNGSMDYNLSKYQKNVEKSLANFKIPRKRTEMKEKRIENEGKVHKSDGNPVKNSTYIAKSGKIPNLSSISSVLPSKSPILKSTELNLVTANTMTISSVQDNNENKVLIPFIDTTYDNSETAKRKSKRVRFADESEKQNLAAVVKSTPQVVALKSLNHSNRINLGNDGNVQHSLNKNFLFTIENVIAKIVQWKVIWLHEQKEFSFPPPVVNMQTLKKVSLMYKSAEEYFNTYFDLLLLEMWQDVYHSWKEINQKQSSEPYTVAVTSYTSFKDIMILHCQTVVNLSKTCGRVNMPFEGNFVILDLRLKDIEKGLSRVFAYVSEHKIENYRNQGDKLLKNLPVCKEPNPQLIRFVVKTKLREENLNLNMLMKVEGLLYLRPRLRHCEAVLNVCDSPLHTCILVPQYECCKLDYIHPISLRSTENFNLLQKSAIQGISAAITESYKVPRVLLLHGPPGTGKTHTVVGVIQQLLFQQIEGKEVKMLIAAPSNAAVDEIGRRLLKRKSHLISSERKVRFVRVGQFEHIHEELKPYFIDELVKFNLRTVQHDADQATEMYINHVQAKINKLLQEISAKEKRGYSENEIRKARLELNKCYSELSFYKNKANINIGSCEKTRLTRLRLNILMKADIILTTLNSCHNGSLISAFGKNSSATFTCCIIDEATQCTEPELLIPLQYGISKLVLVGDPLQLPPTVLSRLAAEKGFHISLFERFSRFFKEMHTQNPVFMLSDQYRMHPEICQFPSSYFYSNQLRSCGTVNFPVKPYIILDIVDSQECLNSPTNIYNMPEANFVRNLCSELLTLIPSTSTIGIITPYHGQRQIFSRCFGVEQTRVKVNTVDGFQGRERDVIILSCVRGNSNNTGNIGFLNDGQRLNVAITRARHSLIICGHMACLRSHEHWSALIRNAEMRNLLFPVKSSKVELVINLLKN